MSTATGELFHVFDARRVKAPEIKGLDVGANAAVGWVKHKMPVLRSLRAMVARVGALEPDIQKLGSTAFKEEVTRLRNLARLGKLNGPELDRAFAMVREGSIRTVQKRPFDVQIMGAAAMTRGYIAEMATGEGKTLTAVLAGCIWAWEGKPVHVITVNDYLVARDAELNKALYNLMGVSVAAVTHETSPQDRLRLYRNDVVYVTSKELVADFLRDQIMLGERRSSSSTVIGMLGGQVTRPVTVPGLFKAVVDEADSLLIDEAVTPLIISNSPEGNANEPLYREASDLAKKLTEGRDFVVDRTERKVDMTARGKVTLQREAEKLIRDGDSTEKFWAGQRRQEELVVQALVAHHCFHLDEQYLITDDGKIAIIDEFTGRVMADRSWRGGLHQAIEVKEGVEVTSDKENLARLSFQRFFRQFPVMAGMTGTGWESRGELWQIYNRPVARIPTNKPCIRKHLPLKFFGTAEAKWDAVAQRVKELHEKGIPVLIGTRSVWSSEEVDRRLNELQLPHRVLNARQDKQEADIVSQAGKKAAITVATNMAGRGTDIHIDDEVKSLGGLHVIATEPHGSHRVDRQLFGRAGRQGDPGVAQMFASAEDDLLKRHADKLRRRWRAVGGARCIRVAQARAEKLARFNRKQVLKADDWMDQSLPF